jgi:septal ring factor EnvC (AmiA/AmiB activator)
MKKTILTLSILMACSGVAFADGNAFTPLNFDDAYTPVRTSAVTTSTAPANTLTSAQKPDQTGNAKMQNAITNLDNAQVEVRNELLDIKTKFADVDAKYQAVKAERKALDKQIKSLERRINRIDKQKENIRKNMI